MRVLARLAALFRAPDSRHDAGPSHGGDLTVEDARLKQLAAVQKMRRGVADVSVSRQRLELQAAELQKVLDSLAAQADAAQTAGDAGTAHTARGRHVIMAEQLGDLVAQRDALSDQEAMLMAGLSQLQARVAGFSATAETLKAGQTAAEARRDIAESLGELKDPGTGA